MKLNKEIDKQKEVIEKLKLYKKYLESNDPKIRQEIDNQMGINSSGENLVMKCDNILGKTITYKQIKKGECPNDYIEKWLRVIDGKQEFKEFKKSIPKNESSKKDISFSDKVKQDTGDVAEFKKLVDILYDLYTKNRQEAINTINQAISEYKMHETVDNKINDQELADQYKKLLNDVSIAIWKKKKNREFVKYDQYIEKAVSNAGLDIEIYKSLVGSKTNFQKHYPVSKKKRIRFFT